MCKKSSGSSEEKTLGVKELEEDLNVGAIFSSTSFVIFVFLHCKGNKFKRNALYKGMDFSFISLHYKGRNSDH